MKKKKQISKIMLALIVIAIIIYTGASFVLQYYTGVEPSPTLTTAWFAFWGTELVALAAIRTSKLKHGVDNTITANTDDVINEEE